MKMPAFSALAMTAAMMMSSGVALAQSSGDGGAPSTVAAEKQGDANAKDLKEGVGKAFSFLRAVGGLAADAARDGAAAAQSKAAEVQAAVAARQAEDAAAAAPAPTMNARQQKMSESKAKDGAQAGAGQASAPGLAQAALGLANSQGAKAALGLVGHLIPGGANALNMGAKALEARARTEHQAPAGGAGGAGGVQRGEGAAPAAVVDAVPNPFSGLMKAGGGLLDKIQARREANSAADGSGAPAPQNKL